MLVGKQPLDLTASSLPPIDIVVFQSALARFRIAAQALYLLRARPVTAVPAELTL